MPRFVSWVPWLIATTLVAQQGPPDAKPAKPAAAAERLEALKAEQTKMIQEWQKAARETQAKAKEAQAAGKPVPAMAMRPDFEPLVASAKASAKEFAGTDDAAPFLMFIVQNSNGKPEDMVEALDTLTDKHVDHASIAELGQMIAYLPRIVPADKAAVFTERLGKSANADVRGWVLFAKHQETIDKADRDSDGYKTAKLELLKAADEVADARLKTEIKGAIDTREKYGVGNVAPDIAGQDLDGVAFKLSDYKGKVVFLDFWGDW